MLGLIAQADPGLSATAEYFGSIGGIVVVTLVLVNVIKKAFGGVAALKSIPVWVYAVVVSIGLTAFARYGLNTLEGNVFDLILQAVIAAGAASGFREWLKDGSVSPEKIVSVSKVIVLTGSVLLFVGCKQYGPADYAFIEASERYHGAVGDPFIEYVKGDESLTPVQKEGRIEAHKKYGEALEARRAAMMGTTVVPVE